MNDHRPIALSFVNRIRMKHGHQPIPKLLEGKPGSPCNCSIAKSLQHEGIATARAEGGSVFGNNPIVTLGRGKLAYFEGMTELKGVIGFIKDFDRGRYPELINR